MNFNQKVAVSLIPPGFAALMEKIASAKAPPPKARRGLLAEIERDLKLGKLPPKLEFSSAANYTYNRHAMALYAMWQARDVIGLTGYKLEGKNTYARALSRYRDLLKANLEEAQ